MKFSPGFRELYFNTIPDLLRIVFKIMEESNTEFKPRFCEIGQDLVISKFSRKLEETLAPYLAETEISFLNYDYIPLGVMHRELSWIKSEAEIEVFFRILLSVLPRNMTPNDSMVIRASLLQVKSVFLLGWKEVGLPKPGY